MQGRSHIGKAGSDECVNETLSVEGMCRLYPVLDSKTGKVSDRPVYESTFISGETKDFAAWKQLPSGDIALSCRFVTVTARKSAMRTIR